MPPGSDDQDAAWLPCYAGSGAGGTAPRLARTSVSGNAARVVGVFESLKNAAPVPWDSMLERDWFAVLETDPMVRRYHPQPGMLRFVDDEGRARRYFPDVLAEFHSFPAAVFEVKPERRAGREATARKHALVRAAFKRFGLRFAVVTEGHIRRQPRFGNALRLLEFRTVEPPQSTVEAARAVFRGPRAPSTLGELRAALGGGETANGWTLAMALRGIVELDLDAGPLCPGTPATLGRFV